MIQANLLYRLGYEGEGDLVASVKKTISLSSFPPIGAVIISHKYEHPVEKMNIIPWDVGGKTDIVDIFAEFSLDDYDAAIDPPENLEQALAELVGAGYKITFKNPDYKEYFKRFWEE